MDTDTTDEVISQWAEERPDLDTSSLGVVVRVLRLNKRMQRRAGAALEPVGLELWAYDVLSALRRQGRPFELSASALAKAAALSPGAMTNRIDRLERQQLVERRYTSDDRRSVRVRLTRDGKRTIDEALELRIGAADRDLECLSRRETATLARLLKKVSLACD